MCKRVNRSGKINGMKKELPANQLSLQTTRPPLADELRPSALDQVVGQDHLLGTGGAIARMIKIGRQTLLFVDEIRKLIRSQQDHFLQE